MAEKTTRNMVSQPDRITVIVGPIGIEALGMMGLEIIHENSQPKEL